MSHEWDSGISARLQRFRIEALLGRGGMGAVYRAVDLELNRPVALKVVQSTGDDDERNARRLRRFQREGEITASLNHPGILRVFSTGVVDGWPYLAYELVEGARGLGEVLHQVDLRRRVELIRDAARALGYAHARDVIHRDVKPDNLLVDLSGHLRVADFGLAAAQGLERLTRTGAVVGTPNWMAPEQAAGETQRQSPATDVWALGVILYQALTGELPFESDSLVGLLSQIALAAPTPPRALEPSVSPELEAICLQAMRAEPEERYPHGEALAQDLDAFLEGKPVGATTSTGFDRAFRQLRRRVPAWALVCLGLALLLIPLSLFFALRSPEAPAKTTVDPGEPAPETKQGLSPEQIAHGRRRLEELRLLAGKPQVLAKQAAAWLVRYEGHPDVERVRALRDQARLAAPVAVFAQRGQRLQALFLDERRVLTYVREKRFVVWDVSDPVHPRPLQEWAERQAATSVVPVPGTPHFVYGNGVGQTFLGTVGAPRGGEALSRRVGGPVWQLALTRHADQTYVAVGFGRRAHMFRLDGTRARGRRDLETFPEIVQDVAFTHDGQRLVVLSGGRSRYKRDQFKVYSLHQAKPLYSHELKLHPTGLALHPDGARVAIGARDGRLLVFRLEDGKQLGSMEDLSLGRARMASEVTHRAHTSAVDHMRFSPDGKLLYSTSRKLKEGDVRLKVWGPAGGQPLRRCRTAGQFTWSLDLSPDGRLLVVGTDSGAELWYAK